MTTTARAREKYVLGVFEKNPDSVKLVDGHGILKGSKKIVPSGVIIMFLSKAGYCMAINSGRTIHKKYFETINGLTKFFKSGEQNRRDHHVTDIMSRTHIPGSLYQDMTIKLVPEANEVTMGFVKKLPITRANVPPLLGNTVGTIFKDTYLLSDIIRKSGKGIYIVSACRVAENNIRNENTPMNLPGIKIGRVNRTSRIFSVSKQIGTMRSKPGARRRTILKPYTLENERFQRISASGRSVAPRPTKQLISLILNRMSQPGEKSRNIRKYAWNIPANKKISYLNYTLRTLRLPRLFVKRLSNNNKLLWNRMDNKQKTRFIYKKVLHYK